MTKTRARETLHLGYAGEVAPELLVLPVQGEPVLARPVLFGRLVDPDGQVLEVLDARQDRLEVGEHAADVALRDEGLPAPDGLLGERDLGLLLGPHEEDLAVRLGDAAHEVQGLLQQRQRLVQVDNMDPGPLGEDVALHLGVPPLGLVPEVDAGLEQLSNSYALGRALQDLYLSFQVVGILRPRLAIRPCDLPADHHPGPMDPAAGVRSCGRDLEGIASSDPADVSTRGWMLLAPVDSFGELALLGEALPEPPRARCAGSARCGPR